LHKGEVYHAVKDYGGAFESAQDVMMKKPYSKKASVDKVLRLTPLV